MTYNHYSDKDMFVSSRNPIIIILIRDKHINAITNSINMICNDKNGNVIIMKCYAKQEILEWCKSMKCFRVMSSGDLSSASRG